MSTSRFLPPILIVGTVLLLTGALPRHSRKSTRLALSSPLPAPAPIAAGTVAEPRALEVLEKALAALAPSKVAWLETTIWQRVRLPGCSFQVDGRYLLAPNRRFRGTNPNSEERVPLSPRTKRPKFRKRTHSDDKKGRGSESRGL